MPEPEPEPEPASEPAPALTMFPHPAGARYWVSGQANIVFQGNLPFHSTYQGPNSFHDSGSYKTSLVGTLYLGAQPLRSARATTELLLDVESTGGRGLSQALGLAGFTNLDVVRNPYLGSAPYLARYQVHETVALSRQLVDGSPGPFSLSAQVPARRLELRLGKMSLADFFDLNAVGSDSHLQFLNWTIDNNGAWDYAADTRGYTTAAVAEYDDSSWSLRYGFAAMPTVANGIDYDWALGREHGQNGEFELRRSPLPGHAGITRILFFANRAHMGVYREAVDAYLAGRDPTPEITSHEHVGALKYGLGVNQQQELTSDVRAFFRFGWNEGEHESFAYTEVDQTVALGLDDRGVRWGRPLDRAGLAFVSNAIKRDHQNYLRLGGLGFLLGDGRLNYGRETILETYYTAHAVRGLFYSAGASFLANPGYNRDRGPVWVGTVRMHVDF